MTRGAKYDGRPCARCGGTLRYRSNKNCVYCTVRNHERYKAYRQTEEYKAKARAYSRKRYADNPEHVKGIAHASQLRKKLQAHGVDEAWYAAQPQHCAICGAEPEGRRLAVDHDDETGQARGLLCGLCNKGIGLLQHDPQVLTRAAAYLAASSNTEDSEC